MLRAVPEVHTTHSSVKSPAVGHHFIRTRLCKFYSRGQCKRGKNCAFAHGVEQLQGQPDLYRTEFCFDYIKSGMCKAGRACKFAHSEGELRRPVLSEAGGTAHEVEELRKQLAAVQAQVASLVRAVGEGAEAPQLRSEATGATGGRGSKCEEATKESDLMVSFSRQTTADDEAESDFSDDEGSVEDDSSEKGDLSGARFSRQTSAESDLPTGAFSCQTTLEKGMWEEGGLSSEGLRLGAAAGVRLFVRKTFIDAEPLVQARSLQRKAASVPADLCKFGYCLEQ